MKALKCVVCILIAASLLFSILHYYVLSKKSIHFSIDDTINVFYDLTENVEKYDSIFDNELLSSLNKLHKKYGLAVTLYCFNENDVFSLADMTAKFKEQFSANSDWLKFGFHAQNPDVDLSLTDFDSFSNSYNQFVSQVTRFAGGTNQIDIFVRLSCFQASGDIVSNLRELGISGLYTSDDYRENYCLNELQNRFLQVYDYEYSAGDSLFYIHTDYRIEEDSFNTFLLLSNKVLEVFTHEWAMNNMGNWQEVDRICEFARQHKYEWCFAQTAMYKTIFKGKVNHV